MFQGLNTGINREVMYDNGSMRAVNASLFV